VTELVACDILPVTKHERLLPESVQEALEELVGAAQERLLAVSVGVGHRFAVAHAGVVEGPRRGAAERAIPVSTPHDATPLWLAAEVVEALTIRLSSGATRRLKSSDRLCPSGMRRLSPPARSDKRSFSPGSSKLERDVMSRHLLKFVERDHFRITPSDRVVMRDGERCLTTVLRSK
jgi:hypothetical protein